ncbi:hypothetical protein N0V83_001775 [Neocucurbitaria cava]|uniref:Uncharacterized protein n=1 Tax=Neocucurbitaria cava TaxID=798079 RepID=A0A9W9CQQ4_9PLEO|nr:hypothetical protein N0V83_001775 [Neocucurbitaria cava]
MGGSGPDHSQKVEIMFKVVRALDRDLAEWYRLRITGTTVRKGDIVCLLEGASSPTIIRPFCDYFAVIMLAVTPIGHDRIQSRTEAPPREFSLVWNWKPSLEDPENLPRKERVGKHGELDYGRATRLWNNAFIWKDLARHRAAKENILRAIQIYGEPANRRHVIQVTEDLLFEILTDFDPKIFDLLLDRRMDDIHVTQKFVPWILRHSNLQTVTSLLDRRGDEIQITEVALIEAVYNTRSGVEMMALLLDKRAHKVKITEAVFLRAITNQADTFDSRYRMVVLLLDRKKDEIEITEAIILAALTNQAGTFDFRYRMVLLLLHRKKGEIKITEAVFIAAVNGDDAYMSVTSLLLARKGDEIQITEAIIAAVRARGINGKAVLQRLLVLRETRLHSEVRHTQHQ